MRILIKYKLNSNGTVPSYALDGGYFMHDNEHMIAISDDSLSLPDTVAVVSIEDFKQLIMGRPMQNCNEEALSDEDKLEYANKWLISKGLISE